MELSILCKKELGLFIYDKEQKVLSIYKSSDAFNTDSIMNEHNKALEESYTNLDYDEFCEMKVDTSKK